jgi:arylsulfatase A-like enzyme/HEAT repeat protein
VKQLRVFADALVAALVVVVSEAVVVGFAYRHEFAASWELRQGVRLLPLVTWVLAAPASLLGAALWLVLRRAERRRARAFLSVTAATGMSVVAVLVSTGRHFASVPLRVGFASLLAGGAAALVWAIAPRLARLERRAPVALGGLAVGGVALLFAGNILILPKLYPAFHAALAALVLLVAPVASLVYLGDEGLREPRPGSRARERAYLAACGLALAACAALVPTIARALARADNVRFVYGQHAPLSGYAVRVIAALEAASERPGQGAEGDAAGVGAAVVPSGNGGLDLRARDVVLISVDALRADHLGCYGYQRPISPNIDALAREGARFTHAYTATPHTSYSVTSMLTGKYMRPLLLQGVGADSDTLARLLRTYGYRTAAFYPPAVFFIDGERFTQLRERGLDFEYRRIEYASADERAAQVDTYLGRARADRKVLLWVHLFEPHEPYVKHDGHDLGDRDVDRYDSEIAAADEGIGRIVEVVRKHRPGAAIVLTADHGEEFGEHGGYHHGTSVYEEQARVPLIWVVPGVVAPRVITTPVQTVDIMPTLLSALSIPRPARVRGRSLGGLLTGAGAAPGAPPDAGFAFAETDEATLLAEGSLRLVCARKLGACQLYDIAADPGQHKDLSALRLDRFDAMRKHLRDVESAHGRYELAGLRAEGRSWPEAIRRGIAGDADAAVDVSALLDDADAVYRRKAAEILFELARVETAPSLRLALTRDEDDVVRRWAALALTRLGEGAGRALELVEDRDVSWRRLAALALAESGDGRGEDTLVSWWQSGELSHERARQVVAALGKIRSKHALVPLIRSLGDVRLRPLIATALAQIGESAARPALLEAFAQERYVAARLSLGRALIDLGAGAEMAPSLARFLGVPDPLPDGLALAEKGGFLVSIGGPDKQDLSRVQRGQGRTIRLNLIIPRGGHAGQGGHDQAVRLLVRGRSRGKAPATIRLGSLGLRGDRDDSMPAELDARSAVELQLAPSDAPTQIVLSLPAALGARPGGGVALALWQSEQAEISSFAIVPLADEIPPPPPRPWTPSADEHTDGVDDDGT